jgi:hypothetical protein
MKMANSVQLKYTNPAYNTIMCVTQRTHSHGLHKVFLPSPQVFHEEKMECSINTVKKNVPLL